MKQWKNEKRCWLSYVFQKCLSIFSNRLQKQVFMGSHKPKFARPGGRHVMIRESFTQARSLARLSEPLPDIHTHDGKYAHIMQSILQSLGTSITKYSGRHVKGIRFWKGWDSRVLCPLRFLHETSTRSIHHSSLSVDIDARSHILHFSSSGLSLKELRFVLLSFKGQL